MALQVAFTPDHAILGHVGKRLFLKGDDILNIGWRNVSYYNVMLGLARNSIQGMYMRRLNFKDL
jgi:hypothetical protein